MKLTNIRAFVNLMLMTIKFIKNLQYSQNIISLCYVKILLQSSIVMNDNKIIMKS